MKSKYEKHSREWLEDRLAEAQAENARLREERDGVRQRAKRATETLRAAFRLRPDCARVEEAARDAVNDFAEFRTQLAAAEHREEQARAHANDRHEAYESECDQHDRTKERLRHTEQDLADAEKERHSISGLYKEMHAMMVAAERERDKLRAELEALRKAAFKVCAGRVTTASKRAVDRITGSDLIDLLMWCREKQFKIESDRQELIVRFDRIIELEEREDAMQRELCSSRAETEKAMLSVRLFCGAHIGLPRESLRRPTQEGREPLPRPALPRVRSR